MLVIGSVAIDEVYRVEGRLARGSHGHARALRSRLGGGAAGVAVPLARAGHRARVVTAVGDDASGDRLLEELQAAGVDTGLVARVPGPSTRSLVLVDEEGERTVLNLSRCPARTPAPDALREADLLYVRSRDPSLAPCLAGALESARVVAHVPPGAPGSRPAHVLVGSESDLSPEWLAGPFDAGRRTAGESLEWVVVTRGARGAAAYGDRRELSVPAPRLEPVDTTGAGDAFAAGLIHGLLSGRPMEAALRTGVEWGSESALWEGSVLPAAASERLARASR